QSNGAQPDYGLERSWPRLVFEIEGRDELAVLGEHSRLRLITACPAGTSQPVVMFADPGLDARPRIFCESREIGRAACAVQRQRTAQRMVRLLRQCGSDAEHQWVDRRTIDQARAAERQSAGLVERDLIDFGEALKSSAILDHDAAFEQSARRDGL